MKKHRDVVKMRQDIRVAYAQLLNILRVLRAPVMEHASQHHVPGLLRAPELIQDPPAQDLSVQVVVLPLPGLFDQGNIMQQDTQGDHRKIRSVFPGQGDRLPVYIPDMLVPEVVMICGFMPVFLLITLVFILIFNVS